MCVCVCVCVCVSRPLSEYLPAKGVTWGRIKDKKIQPNEILLKAHLREMNKENNSPCYYRIISQYNMLTLTEYSVLLVLWVLFTLSTLCSEYSAPWVLCRLSTLCSDYSVLWGLKIIWFGSSFRPTLSSYVRPKLFYDLGRKNKVLMQTWITFLCSTSSFCTRMSAFSRFLNEKNLPIIRCRWKK